MTVSQIEEAKFLDEDLSFLSAEEVDLSQRFIRDGYLVLPAENLSCLNGIRGLVASLAAESVGISEVLSVDSFLNFFGSKISASELNSVRVRVINAIIQTATFRPALYHIAKKVLGTLVGNELVMQRGVGLSVQLPGDRSSLLNVHADSWSGDSPYEVVLWVPLVDCYSTKSMFILPPEPAKDVVNNFSFYQRMTNSEFFDAIKKDVEFLTVPYGHVLLFNQNLPHGNRVNEEETTRWSLNCRFKSIFSPYADKRIGEFFLPITMRALTRVGMAHKYPRV